MKILLSFFICFTLYVPPAGARDFVVEFVQEHYKETRAQFSYQPLIYHSIQVNTDAGPKVIILKGDDLNYRKWLRHYIAQDKRFILKIEDDLKDNFIASKAFEIDIHSVHPIDPKQWSDLTQKDETGSTLSGSGYVLVVDHNEKRAGLLRTVFESMGFQIAYFKTNKKAIASFKLQPEKFEIAIINHAVISNQKEDIVSRLVKIDHTIPVMIDTGYRQDDIRNKYKARYSNIPSVVVKSMILQDLSKTMERFGVNNG